MAVTSRNTLKGWFQRGYYPTAGQFASFIDSCFNLNDDSIAIADVAGLSASLGGKASMAAVNNALAIANAALAATGKRATVLFDNQQEFDFNAADYPNSAAPLSALFWVVHDELPGYVEGDKSTWFYKQAPADASFTVDADGNPVTYTFDLGFTPLHGMYQIL